MKKTKKLIICTLASFIVIIVGALLAPTWTASIQEKNSINVL